MNPQSEKSPLQVTPHSVLPLAAPARQACEPVTLGTPDRVYQIAALTAGAFLLATLL
ncbi:MAG TPA: hypothetical protein VNU92_00070 [Edaphobacter sp.]|jgi:hypothetical protein|nr:hypothetical protein [Edaphobacter sp.]